MKGRTGLKKPPLPPRGGKEMGYESGEGGEGRDVIVGKNGFWSFSSQKTDGYGTRWKLRKPRKTQRGQFKKRRNQCKHQYKNRKKKKKDTHTHSNKRATEIFVSFFLSKCIDKRNIIELKKTEIEKKLSRPRILCDVQGHSRQQT